MKNNAPQLVPVSLLASGLAVLSLQAAAQLPPPQNPEEVLSNAYTGRSYSPYAGRSTALFPLWGDTHLHTANSFDAGAFGNRLTPEDAVAGILRRPNPVR